MIGLNWIIYITRWRSAVVLPKIGLSHVRNMSAFLLFNYYRESRMLLLCVFFIFFCSPFSIQSQYFMAHRIVISVVSIVCTYPIYCICKWHQPYDFHNLRRSHSDFFFNVDKLSWNINNIGNIIGRYLVPI